MLKLGVHDGGREGGREGKDTRQSFAFQIRGRQMKLGVLSKGESAFFSFASRLAPHASRSSRSSRYLLPSMLSVN